MEYLKKKLPDFQEIIPVYAVSASLLFGWALILFAWNLPSWIKFMSLGELLSVLSYSVAATFLQTLLFITAILIVCLALPSSILRSEFVVRGALASFVCLGLVLLRSYLKASNPWYFINPVSFLAICVGGTILLAFVASRYAAFQRMVATLADRLIIFLYVLVPLTLISLLTVVIRNLV